MGQRYIGEVAKLVERHPETLRRYERKGLIPQSKRDPFNGRRVWDDSQVETITKLCSPQEDSPNQQHGERS